MDLPIADAFEALRSSDPSAPVAWTPAGVRDRAALHERARAVERMLTATPAGCRVGLSVRDGFTLLAAFLAVARTRRCALLLDAADPRAPRVDLATRFGAAALLTDVDGLRVLPAGGDAAAGALRAIKLTSGSTGEPRAIGVDDRALRADATQLERAMGIGDGDRLLAAVPMSFSYGVGNLLVPALAAGRVLVLPDAAHPLGLLRAMRSGAPTVLPAVPALLRALLRGGFAPPPSLRLVISAGAPLPVEVAAACRARFGLPVHAFYGSTESGGICYDPTGTAAERGLVGRPIDGVDVTLRADGQLVVRSAAVGVALDGGRGDGGNPADGAFVTPDLAAFVDGELRLLGRAGAVFDVGGHKVDPAELEGLIGAMPGVREVAVVPWRDEHGRASCAALVAAAATAALRGDDVRRQCARVLPAAKVPRRVAIVEHLPRCVRGKLQRVEVERLLASPEQAEHGGGAGGGDS